MSKIDLAFYLTKNTKCMYITDIVGINIRHALLLNMILCIVHLLRESIRHIFSKRNAARNIQLSG